MIPPIFALGEDRGTAVGRLTQAGYSRSAIEPFDADDVIVSCGNSLCERKPVGYTDFFEKSVPPVSPMNLVCNLDYVVWLAFDIKANLQKARNGLCD